MFLQEECNTKGLCAHRRLEHSPADDGVAAGAAPAVDALWRLCSRILELVHSFTQNIAATTTTTTSKRTQLPPRNNIMVVGVLGIVVGTIVGLFLVSIGVFVHLHIRDRRRTNSDEDDIELQTVEPPRKIALMSMFWRSCAPSGSSEVSDVLSFLLTAYADSAFLRIRKHETQHHICPNTHPAWHCTGGLHRILDQNNPDRTPGPNTWT